MSFFDMKQYSTSGKIKCSAAIRQWSTFTGIYGPKRPQNASISRVSSTEVRFPRIGGFRAIRRFQIRCDTLFDAQRHHYLRFDRLEMCRVP